MESEHCCHITAAGFTHPVEDFYLEDALRFTGYAVKELAAGGSGAAKVRNPTTSFKGRPQEQTARGATCLLFSRIQSS